MTRPMSMRLVRAAAPALAFASMLAASCSRSPSTTETLVESPAAAARIAEHRARFALPGTPPLAASLRGAHVVLPWRANDAVRVEDRTSHLAIRFTLDHVQDARIEMAGGMALYRDALDTGNARADVLHRVHAEGTEDYVVFEKRPAREELSYSVDVSGVSGLRLVSNTLEFLDATGTPLLRVAPPYVLDVRGHTHEAKLAVTGCAYDTSPAGPWGRKITRPGAEHCSVHVTWAGDVAYPAMVDPAWTSTGNMGVRRESHTASVLPSGKVLVAGGSNTTYVASAELYDATANGGAGTFAATGSLSTARKLHTSTVLPSGKVLIVAGYGVSAHLASGELYDDAAGTFTAAGSMITARAGHAVSLLPSGKLLVAGGYSGPSAFLVSAEIFDPAANGGAGTFAATGSMIGARGDHTATALPSGNVLVAGGTNAISGVALASAEIFDPAGNGGAGTFAAAGSMAASRRRHTASVLASGKVLVTGGFAGAPALASAEVFDPAGNAGAGTFAATGSMTTARGDHTASALPSGKVFVVGGNSGVALATTELYDPAGNAGAGSFVAGGVMVTARIFHTMSVLPSGNVLVAGGRDAASAGTPQASAEVYAFVSGACANADDCLSGFCADGKCCDTACSGGGCDRCDLPGKAGTCSVVVAGNPGVECGRYTCDGVSGICPASCASDTACVAGAYCDPKGSCEPKTAPGVATCDGDHTTTNENGMKKDCAPYKCDSIAGCRSVCTSVTDCVAPTVCDTSGRCVTPSGDPGSDDGCSVVGATGHPAPRQAAWLVAAFGLALLRRRRQGRVPS